MASQGTDFRRELGQQLRVDSVRTSAAANSGHPTSSMSAADLMAVLLDGHLRLDYQNPANPANDHLVFSKGHASPLYYAILKAAGRDRRRRAADVPQAQLAAGGPPHPARSRRPTWRRARSARACRSPSASRWRAATSTSCPYRVWCLCGDSEMAEGSMWEAFQHAGWEGLDNLDRDHRRQPPRPDPRDDARLGPGRLRRAASEAFGWNAIEIDGHDVDAIEAAYAEAEATKGKPTAIIARTKKGKGVKAVEDLPGKHGKPLDDPDAAIEELGGYRDLTVEVAKPEAGEPHTFEHPGGELPTLGARRGGRHPQGVRRGAGRARRDRRRHRRARRRGLQLDALGGLPRGARGPLLRDVHRGAAARRRRRSGCRSAAAGSRSPRRSRRSSRARTTSSAWRRSAAPTCGSSARTPACRSARTGRRRWRWRTSRRCARSTPRPCCTRPTPTRRRS